MSLAQHRDEGLPVEVRAYAGAFGEEEPRALRLGEQWSEVREILERWAEPKGRFFRVSADDGGVYLLFCREPDLEWSLVFDTTKMR